jgi:4-amino-4-deoxy-L-arabinose transferase-like glycosyltransferase
VIPADFLPWSLLLPAGIVHGWRARRETGPAARGLLFALCWMMMTVLFFSISPAKRSVYVLTMYPGMALLVGAALDRLEGDARRARCWVGWPLAVFAGLVVLAAIALPAVALDRPEARPLGGAAFVWTLAASLLPLAAGAALGAAWAWRGRAVRSAAALAAGTAAFWLAAALLLMPRFDAVKSARALSQELLARAAPDEPYAIYPRLDSTFLFYTRRFAVEPAGEVELLEFGVRPGRVWLLIQRDDLRKAEEKLGRTLPFVEVARDLDEKEGYLLMTNRP